MAGVLEKIKENREESDTLASVLRYAAILLISSGAAIYGVLHSGEETVSLADLNAITPGGTRAELVLPSGEVIDLVEKRGYIAWGKYGH